jgi:hypothetical protein
MNWRDEWIALAGRIDGLLRAGEFFVLTLRISSEDPYRVADNHLGKQAREIVDGLSSFLDSYRSAIPIGAVGALERFLQRYSAHIKDETLQELPGLKLRLTALAALRAEIQYHLSDFEALAIKRAERAFLHLRQSIVVDEELRRKWQAAFKSGELACEKLGATHLMLHGIWAFKVSAKGGRTDLVFGNAIPDSQTVTQVAEALVLTEWKIVRDAAKVERIAETAREQLRQYSSGVLAGIELSNYRYAVLVSKTQLPELEDIQVGSGKCRHINIPVSPLAPSKAARR